MERIDFIVGVYEGENVDEVLDDLKQVVNNDLHVLNKYDTFTTLVETSLEYFEAAFGTRPLYDGKNGWSYKAGERAEVPASLDQRIEDIDLNYTFQHCMR